MTDEETVKAALIKARAMQCETDDKPIDWDDLAQAAITALKEARAGGETTSQLLRSPPAAE